MHNRAVAKTAECQESKDTSCGPLKDGTEDSEIVEVVSVIEGIPTAKRWTILHK